jgi:hypothetical protein
MHCLVDIIVSHLLKVTEKKSTQLLSIENTQRRVIVNVQGDTDLVFPDRKKRREYHGYSSMHFHMAFMSPNPHPPASQGIYNILTFSKFNLEWAGPSRAILTRYLFNVPRLGRPSSPFLIYSDVSEANDVIHKDAEF